MKNKMELAQYKLNNKTIDEISEHIQQYMQTLGIEKTKGLRIRLLTEEILLNWMQHFGEDASIQVLTGKKFGNHQLIMRIKGDKFDPLTWQDAEYSEYLAHISESLGLLPTYHYKNGMNTIAFKLTKEVNTILQLFITLLLAIIVGFAGKLLPANFRNGVCEAVLTPLYDTFLGILSTVAGPMIFLSVTWGIYGIGDTETLGTIGKKMLSRFLVMTLVTTILSMAVCIPLFHLSFAKSQVIGNDYGSIIQLLLGIFPTNIVSPFLDGNTMQIILMAIVVGCVLLILGSQTKMVAEFIEQLNHIINYLMGFVGKLLPVFIFLVVLDMIWKDTLQTITTAWKPIVMLCVLSFALLLCSSSALCLRNKVNLTILLKKLFPSFLIGITTASSSAAFGTMVSCCDKELGIDNKVSGFGIPLGIVLYKPITAINFVVCALYFTELYNVQISTSWFVIAVIVITIISIALPPIPGGALACYTIVFSQLGIPATALTFMLILDVIFDFICTGFSLPLLQCELAALARKLGMLDCNMLREHK